MLLSESANEYLFYFFVELLENQFNARFTLKADGFDSKYFDFIIDDYEITIHLQFWIGIELFPTSDFNEIIDQEGINDFINSLGLKLLEEKNKIEIEIKKID